MSRGSLEDRALREMQRRREPVAGGRRAAPEMTSSVGMAGEASHHEVARVQSLPVQDASSHGGGSLQESVRATAPLSHGQEEMMFRNRNNREGEIEARSFATLGNPMTAQEASLQDVVSQSVREGESLRGAMTAPFSIPSSATSQGYNEPRTPFAIER